MSEVSDATWARLRAQVEAFQGERIADAEARRRCEFKDALKATGWDGGACRADPNRLVQTDPSQVYIVEHFWFGLVRAEYAISGHLFLKAQRDLSWAFRNGYSPWDAQVTRLLAKHGDGPVWTRREARVSARALRALFAEAGQI